MPAARRPIEERFWTKVNKNGPTISMSIGQCWLWTGATYNFGYGVLSVSRLEGNVQAHRFSWQFHFGPIPGDQCVLHKCDNPACVNPDHLFLGTRKINNEDMRLKGRHKNPPYNNIPPPSHLGAAHPNAKLTDDCVRQIRALRLQGLSNKTLSAMFGVSIPQVWNIVTHRAWKHLI